MFMKISGIQRQVLISSCLYLGQALVGYSNSWPGPVLPKLRDLRTSPLPYLLTETQLSLVATFMYLGGIIGPYIVLWLSNVKGRKPCFILGGVIVSIGYIMMVTTRNFALLLIGRYLLGIGIGAIAITNLVYIGEIASARIRGILLTTLGIFQTIGSIVLFATGPYVSYEWTCYIALIVTVVFIFCILFIPETPIFYALQDNDEELRKVLQNLDRMEDMNELLEAKEELKMRDTKRDWKDLFSIRSNRKALFVVVVINLLQHGSGVLAVLFFSATIFDMAGSSIKSSISMIIIGCFQLSGSSVTPIFIERVGRRVILIISSTICSLSMFILGLYFYLDYNENPVITHIKWLPLVLLIVFYVAYDSGLGIIPNVIIGEMFTSNVRSKGSTVTMTTSWLFGFAVSTAFGALLEAVGGHVAFWFFSATCAVAALFTIFFIPETKGKTLLEIQKAL
ncbi:facilitated trehalose transporter Tret1 [Bicyclus anynana]|uniref:Facilitated trehalose transporter Tret1 n=1 Tax=Bicyclus anynana TaxID=110368 RepID=A0A6J1MWQ6_BICAN|nr:facilitated trehalose transporter Tret1 [Bicyclus anynana]